MPYRNTILATGEIYHILNRGVAQAPIFLIKKDYLRFLDLVNYYRFSSPPSSFSHFERLTNEEKNGYFTDMKNKNLLLAEIFTYCLMPNHFHFLLKQTAEKGISIMFSKVQNGYAKYFNLSKERHGPLFQSMFKAIRIENDEQFLHVSRYIHLNPSTSFLVKIEKLTSYPWSSFNEYVERDKSSSFLNTNQILEMIGGEEKYKEFVLDQAEYQQKLGMIKHLCLEYP